MSVCTGLITARTHTHKYRHTHTQMYTYRHTHTRTRYAHRVFSQVLSLDQGVCNLDLVHVCVCNR